MAALQQPQFSLIDENGVDLLSANVYLHETDVSIGAKDDPLAHKMYSGPDGAWTLPYPNIVGGYPLFGNAYAPMDEFTPGKLLWPNGESPAACGPATQGPVGVTVQLGNSSEVFQAATGCQTFSATEPTGDTLTLSSYPNGTFTYTKRDGTQVIFSGFSTVSYPTDYTVQQITYPDGRVLTYWYSNDDIGAPYLKSVTRSDGLQLKYTYGKMPNGEWELTSVTAINNAYEYCSPTADTCSLKMAWPTATYSYSGGTGGLTMTVTDAAGLVAIYGMDEYGRTVGVKLPSNPSLTTENFTYSYCDGCQQYSAVPATANPMHYVVGVVRNGEPWTYGGSVAGLARNVCIQASYGSTNPVGSGKTVWQEECESVDGNFINSQFSLGYDPFIQMTDEQGNIFYGPGPLISRETMPEGNQLVYTWDVADLSKETRVPKPGSSLLSVPSSANYHWSGCNYLTCNEPNWVKDYNGNETDYTYDSRNGKVLTVLRPPDANGIRPQTNYTYVQEYAWALNASSGSLVQSPPIWVLSTESYCLTSATTPTGGCTLAGDQVVKTYYYGPDSGTVPNNLFLRGAQVQANGQTRVTCYGYDSLGHQISVTTPNAGLGLTSCDQFTQN